MKIECIKSKIQRSVLLSERMAGKNLSLPILSNILLMAKDKNLTIRSTNLDIGIEIKIAAAVEREGALTVKPGVLGNFLNNLNEDKIKLEVVNGNIKIETKTVSTTIKSESAEDFPVIPAVNKGRSLVISGLDLAAGLKSVFFTASTSDIKPEISSVYIYKDNDQLVFVATDSFRLAENKINLKNNRGDFESVIIPFRNVTEIIRVFEDEERELNIFSDNNQISFHLDDLFVTSRVIDGIYPDYRQIMPKQFKTKLNLVKDDLIQAFKISNIFLDKLNQVSLTTNNKNKTLEIKSKNQDIGENIIKIPVEIEGDEITTNLNAKYISDALNVINSEKISLNFNEANKPLFIQGGNKNFSYLVMPLNR